MLEVLVGLLPGLIWLSFYLKEDLHPEPKRLLLLTFLAGAGFSVIALVLQLAVNNFLPPLNFAPTSFSLREIVTLVLPLFILAAIEECTKFGAAYAAIHHNPEFDEPVDAMIYMVVAALGFATVENIGALHGLTPNIAFMGNLVETLSLRFVGATLLHTLTSATVGYFWAISIRDFNSRRFVVWGLVIATTLHAAFNYLILLYDSFAFPVLLVLVVGFFVLNDFESLRTKAL